MIWLPEIEKSPVLKDLQTVGNRRAGRRDTDPTQASENRGPLDVPSTVGGDGLAVQWG